MSLRYKLKGLRGTEMSVDKKSTLRRQKSRNRKEINKKADLLRVKFKGQSESLSVTVVDEDRIGIRD